MTLRHLNIFLSVYDNHCNTTRAAEELHMTQPAVSLAIKELEQYYGVVLFDRIGRRLRITEAGKHFYDRALPILNQFDDLEKSMRDWDSFGLLRIGASITIGSQFLPHYVKTFYHLFPQTQVHVFIGPTGQLEQKLLNNELDLALAEGEITEPCLLAEDYMEDHLSVICPSGGTYSSGQILTPEEFRSQKFLLRERGSGTREVFEDAVRQAGLAVTPVWEAMSTTALVNAVINGLGITVLPHRMLIGPLEQGLVTAVQVEGLNFHRTFRMVYHKEKFLTASARAFMKLCRNYELDYPIPGYHGLY